MFKGIITVLMVGPTIPVPAPAALADAIESIEVRNSDEGRDGFQIIFKVGRAGAQNPSDNMLDYSLINNPLLSTFNRVIVLLMFGLSPTVLIDGIITHRQLSPSSEPGQSKFTIIGEDVSVMMDRKESTITHPNQSDAAIVYKIIGSYSSQYGLVPTVVPPDYMDEPVAVHRIPSQQATDLQYIKALADTYDYVFYIEPSSIPGMNTAYWGPKQYVGTPQKALTVKMGSETNVKSINFQHSSLDFTIVTGNIPDPILNVTMPVVATGSLRPPLSAIPDWTVNIANARIKQYRATGVNYVQAINEAQSETDRSTDAVTVTGELDGMLYGDVLRARKLVDLRGVGYMHDGLYYVKNVTHKIRKGEYNQSFTLVREGLGSRTPVVMP